MDPEERKKPSPFLLFLKNNIANFLTLSRIVFSLLLFLFPVFSIPFWIFYALSGLSDVLDGFLARKLSTQSKKGALLDSLSDLVFFTVLAILLLAKVSLPPWIWIVASVVALIRITGYLTAFFRFHAFLSLHTYLNKLTGLLLFLSPVLYYCTGLLVTGIVLASVSTLSSLEELILDITMAEADRDRKGLFLK
jgi:CDP-diacylglycerol--glycerol-3-phosphate 3-phosphatidyltransferase